MTASTEHSQRAHARANSALEVEPAESTDERRAGLAALVDGRVVALTDPTSPAAEQYRMLRHRLERLARTDSRRVFAVTSALRGEGKTTTAVNLALTLAQVPGRRVALVDLDLGRGQVHRLLGFQPRIGLADALAGQVELESVLWRFGDTGLYVAPAGRPPADASALLYGTRADALIEQLRARFDLVVLDTTPLLAAAEAQAALDWSDGALLVVRAGDTTREVVEMALDVMPPEKMLGCVLNDVRPHESAGLEPALKALPRRERVTRPLLPAEEVSPVGNRPALPSHA